MTHAVEATPRETVLVEDASRIQVMGIPVLEPVPSPGAPYELTDPFILVHEGRFRPADIADKDTRHPHRGFDNLWYVLHGSTSTGHTTGPDGAMERARLSEGSLLWLRAGRGVWHAEALGADEVAQGGGETEFRGVLFWVNLARKDKNAEPRARVLSRDEIPQHRQGDAAVRVLVGEGSPLQLGTRALTLDVELAEGGQVTTPVPREFQSFVYVLDGEAAFGENQRQAGAAQLVLLGPGEELTVTDAVPGTRFMLLAGEPYGETPEFNGPYVD